MSRLLKRSESFDNDVFFDIEAKRTCLIVGKFISKRSEHVYIKEFKIEAKRTHSIVRKFISKRSEHVYINELKNCSEENTFDSLKIYFEAKRTCLY
jgi:hypothetical protein